ncbi:MAG: hypothetical protein ICV83_11710, partial [Cytophagales bacterium]|nr:hypothetical protein [Cytophagales bacterium]
RELPRAEGTRLPGGIPGRGLHPVPAPPDHVVANPAVPASNGFRPEKEDQTEAAPAPAPMAVVDPLEPVATLQALPAPEGAGLGPAWKQPVKRVKVLAPRTLTRQQQRAIARMKRRAIQRRKANEFLKGNVPYVVPLNPNSF